LVRVQPGELDQTLYYLTTLLPRFSSTEEALALLASWTASPSHPDPEPNLALWSTEDPVTLFAARGLVDSGTEPVTATFRLVASTFSDVATFDWETLASGVAGDFAYTAAVERYTNSRDGGPAEQTELRATHVYRREGGRWRAVHRHADRRPPGR
jgi:ketosteroid isomerase-like protein